MANEYATLALLKTYLGITDSTRDDLLNQALASASRGIDRACGQRFYLDALTSQRTYNPLRRVYTDASGQLLLTDPIGSASGLVVEIGSGSSWAAVTDYETYPDNAMTNGVPITGLLRPSSLWTWSYSSRTRVRVTARWGWPATPDDIETATLIQASRLFKRKDSPEGVMGSAEWGVVRLSRRDPDVWNLLEPYVLPGF
ncbi:head-tail connector protein [Streptomyces sp. SS7]|uniref:head-tail connector protein n=1 Tax=Streptomyces sp. SS7 TaxID=3108485 RepID=UPI0030ED7CF7